MNETKPPKFLKISNSLIFTKTVVFEIFDTEEWIISFFQATKAQIKTLEIRKFEKKSSGYRIAISSVNVIVRKGKWFGRPKIYRERWK